MLGRFLSVDPVAALGDPINYFNRYKYANNNPYKFTDPDGRAFACDAGSCTIDCNSIGTCSFDYVSVGLIYTGRLIENAIENIQRNEAQDNNTDQPETGNTNPYDGPVDEPVIAIDNDGNAIPVDKGEQITSSPNGDYQQVRDKDGSPTGTRLDRGGHKGQSDSQAQGPHAHRPGVTDEKGNPHLPINEPKPPPEKIK